MPDAAVLFLRITEPVAEPVVPKVRAPPLETLKLELAMVRVFAP